MKYEAIDEFLARVKQLSRAGSKDMRMSFQEANNLALTLAEMLSQLNKQTPTVVASNPSVIDGGTFSDRAKPK